MEFLPHLNITSHLCNRDPYLESKWFDYLSRVAKTNRGKNIRVRLLMTTLILKNRKHLVFDQEKGYFNPSPEAIKGWLKGVHKKSSKYREFCLKVIMTLPPEDFVTGNRELTTLYEKVEDILSDATAKYLEEVQQSRSEQPPEGEAPP